MRASHLIGFIDAWLEPGSIGPAAELLKSLNAFVKDAVRIQLGWPRSPAVPRRRRHLHEGQRRRRRSRRGADLRRQCSGGRRRIARTPRKNLLDSLTAREEQILNLVAERRSNNEVDNLLDIRERTVKPDTTTILQKLQARTCVEAAILAREHPRRPDRRTGEYVRPFISGREMLDYAKV